jgi:carbonic anhydrase
MKYHKNFIIFTLTTVLALLTQQVISSNDFSPSQFLETLPNTPGASMFGNRSYSFKQRASLLKKKKTSKRKVDPKKMYLQDYLSISSSVFKNTRIYPPIVLPNGEENIIHVDRKNFRINSEYEKGNKKGGASKRFFWFRLSGRHIYYSSNSKDMNILDNIYVSKISHALPLGDFSKQAYCFYFKDIRRIKFKVCGTSVIQRNKWVCQLQYNLGQPLDPVCKTLNKKKKKSGSESAVGNDKIIEKTVTQPLIIIPEPSRMCNEKWDYSNKGRDWECECREGQHQSPIDLPPPKKAVTSSLKPVFEYEEVTPISPSDFKDGLVKSGQPIKIRYIQNAIRIYHPNMGKVITLDGAVYVAEEIIFHTPSEHTINGQRFEMEMQIIHRGVTTGDIAKTVILSLLFKKKAGSYNKFIERLDIYNLPNPNEPLRDIDENLYIPYAFLDNKAPDMPLMNPFSFYTYSGSETQPPCAERTIHYVVSKPINIGSVALEMFKEAIRAPDFINETGELVSPKFKPINYRVTQKLNGRAIFYYDHIAYCGPSNNSLSLSINNGKRRVKGHYEKKVSTATEYFYVSGDKPSGLPGAYVVSKKEAVEPDQN